MHAIPNQLVSLVVANLNRTLKVTVPGGLGAANWQLGLEEHLAYLSFSVSVVVLRSGSRSSYTCKMHCPSILVDASKNKKSLLNILVPQC